MRTPPKRGPRGFWADRIDQIPIGSTIYCNSNSDLQQSLRASKKVGAKLTSKKLKDGGWEVRRVA